MSVTQALLVAVSPSFVTTNEYLISCPSSTCVFESGSALFTTFKSGSVGSALVLCVVEVPVLVGLGSPLPASPGLVSLGSKITVL